MRIKKYRFCEEEGEESRTFGYPTILWKGMVLVYPLERSGYKLCSPTLRNICHFQFLFLTEKPSANWCFAFYATINSCGAIIIAGWNVIRLIQ